jgi:ABC-type uncharacterized transport system auxiliary subunit
MKLVALALTVAACGGAAPETRYYQLATPTAPEKATAGGTQIAVEPLTADGAYADERIVYRLDPVRLDFYDYHRWSTSPGAMLGCYLEQALARSGQFASVTHAATSSTTAVLGGRVVALEEVDVDTQHWVGHVAIELTLRDAKTSAIIWARTFDQREPEAVRSPEGLARAVGVAMGRIVDSAAPELAAMANHTAQARN